MASSKTAPPPSFRPIWEDAVIDIAINAGCKKSKRGVIIVDPATGLIHSAGSNGPPRGFPCYEAGCERVCNRVAVHAEERAILAASGPIRGFHLVHIKVVEGRAVPSGGPSCWQCSRAVVEAGLAGVWLKHTEGWEFYEAQLFHQLTLRNNDLIPRFCKDCGCLLARELGGLETHNGDCKYLPL